MVTKREKKITGMEKILLHLYKYNRYRDQIEVPPALSQDGIADAIGIAQRNVSTAVRKLEERAEVFEKMSHIQGGKRRKKTYFLTEKGIREAEKLKRNLESSQYIDFADQAPKISYFFGRENELEEFSEWLESKESKMLMVWGIAGMGKTVYITKAVEPFRDSMHIFWHRFHEWSTLRTFLTRLGNFLSEIGRMRLSGNLEVTESIDINEIAIILAEDLEHLNALLVFDDYHKIKDNREIIHMFDAVKQILEEKPGTKIIVIGREVSRFFYDEREISIKQTIKEINLEGLDLESSLEILKMKGIPDEDGKRIYQLTKGHPLSLELIHKAEKFKTQDEVKRFIMDEIFSELSPQERKILEIASVFRYPIYPTAYLDIAGAYAFDERVKELPPSLLSLSEGGSDGMAEVIDYGVIDSLVKKSLLQVSEGVCDSHDFIREFVYEHLPKQVKTRYHDRIAKYYVLEMTESTQTHLEAVYHLLMAEEYQETMERLIEIGKDLVKEGYWQELLEAIDKIPAEAIKGSVVGEILLLRGQLYVIQGDNERAIKDYELSIQEFKKVKNKLGVAEAIRGLGNIMVNKSEWDNAINHLKKALEISKEIGDADGLGEAYMKIGSALGGKGEFDKAIGEVEKAIEYSTKAGNEQNIAQQYISMGALVGYKGDYDKEIEYLNKSLEILKRIGDNYGLARAYNNLGVIGDEKGEYKEAVKWYERTLNLTEKVGYIRLHAYSLSNAAEAYANLNDLDKALEYCDRASAILGKIEENILIVHTEMIYGIIYHKKKDLKMSEKHFQKAINESIEGELPYLGAQINYNYALMLKELGNKGKSRQHFENSIKSFEKLGNNSMVEKVKEEMGEL
jgi:tetratricopeptide (TPR) repeat protein/DNA-binding MarR family transcriptional regulator